MPDPPSKMTAVAALYNRSVTTDLEIGRYGIDLCFNTTTAQLATSLRSGNANPDSPPAPFGPSADDYTGYIRDRSEIASDYFKGLNVVLAMTKPKSDDEVNNDISIVSPIYQKLSTTNKINLKLGMCSAGEDAWAYYISGTNEGSTTVWELSLATLSPSQHAVNDAAINSSLAAWYDPDPEALSRHIVYQLNDSNRTLQEVEMTSGQDQKYKLGVGDAIKGTSLSIVYFEKKVYLYYIATDNIVRRTVRLAPGNWQPSQAVSGAAKVAPGGQLTAVNCGGINHLFYQTGDTVNSITHIRDTKFRTS